MLDKALNWKRRMPDAEILSLVQMSVIWLKYFYFILADILLRILTKNILVRTKQKMGADSSLEK